MKENFVVKACIDWMFAHGCFVWRNNSGAYKPEGYNRYIRFGLKGSADIIGVTPHGTFIGVECKSDKGKLKPEQEEFGRRIKERAGIYIVARSIDDLESRKGEILA